MTFAELETQVNKNTAAISSLSNSLSNYATTAQLNSTTSIANSNTANITNLTDLVNRLNQAISLINKLGSLLDVNIKDLQKGDVLQYDGDRWTNVESSNLVPSASMSLNDLTDVSIDNTTKTNSHALVWDTTKQKWTNKWVMTTQSGEISIDLSQVWNELSSVDASKKIDISHCQDWAINKQGGSGSNITISNLTVTNGMSASNSGVGLDIKTTGVNVTGNLIGTGEVTAYS